MTTKRDKEVKKEDYCRQFVIVMGTENRKGDGGEKEKFGIIDDADDGENGLSHHEAPGVGGGFWTSCRSKVTGWKYWPGTTKNKILSLLSFLGFMGFVMILVHGRVIYRSMIKGSDETCMSQPCIEMGTAMRSAIQFSADPCTDFYQYACGGWLDKKESGPPSSPSADNPRAEVAYTPPFIGAVGHNMLTLIDVLMTEEIEAKGKEEDVESKLQKYWHSCIDPLEIRESRGVTPLVDLVEKKLGGCSLLPFTGFRLRDWNFQKLLTNLHFKFAVAKNLFFLSAVFVNPRHPGSNMIHLTTHPDALEVLGLRYKIGQKLVVKDDNDDDDVATLDRMMEIAARLGARNSDNGRNLTLKMLTDVKDLGKKIKNLQKTTSTLPAKDENSKYLEMNLTELTQLCGVVNWTNYFEMALRSTGHTQLVPSINSSLVILVHHPQSYLKQLCGLIEQQLSSDSGKILLNNYMIWKVVETMTPYLSDEFGTDPSSLTKVQNCIMDLVLPTSTLSSLHVAVAYAYLRRRNYVKKEKGMAEEMIENIQKALRTNLDDWKQNYWWVDEDAKSWAMDKAAGTEFVVGYEEGSMMNRTIVNQIYSGLTMDRNSLFENVLECAAFEKKHEWSKLHQPVDRRTEYTFAPLLAHAFQLPFPNVVMVPPGIFERPLFHTEFPASVRYGSLGMILAHELLHGFTTAGRQYDKNGQLQPQDESSWSNETMANFETAATCLVDQYSGIQLVNKNKKQTLVDGVKTLDENIADNGGLKLAFEAYDKVRGRHGDTQLPKLNLSHEQLFFVSFAQLWCENQGLEKLGTKGEGDEMDEEEDGDHAPSPVRVRETLKNFPQFAKAFQCPKGSPMNPEKKCSVW